MYNPDGLAGGTRRNARDVDLNRNFPNNWVDLDGDYESGPRPASEPESRAVMRFLRDIRPRWILSFHQPCHGTMTGWFNNRFRGAALTVEYGADPSRRRMQVTAPRQVLSIWAPTATAERGRARWSSGSCTDGLTGYGVPMSRSPEDEERIESRAELLPEEDEAGSDDPEAQAEAILDESDERVDDPEGTRSESTQTPGP